MVDVYEEDGDSFSVYGPHMGNRDRIAGLNEGDGEY